MDSMGNPNMTTMVKVVPIEVDLPQLLSKTFVLVIESVATACFPAIERAEDIRILVFVSLPSIKPVTEGICKNRNVSTSPYLGRSCLNGDDVIIASPLQAGVLQTEDFSTAHARRLNKSNDTQG